ncbi:MAG: NAD-dependent epimerase/dehydratase family protein [Deltaproteobacteria bacterium]|nr:MAG: NAD-dependent epimerase/dehydratase family protein [Deltaproteobacteria bacterium]
MRVFVTGGSGFIGRNFVEKAVSRGWSLTCLVRNREKAAWMESLPGLRIVVGHLHAPDTYAGALEEVDYVVHLAGLTKATRVEEFYRVNSEGTRVFSQTVADSGREVKKALLVSSLSVAGPATSKKPAREESPPEPITHYGRSKLEGERHFTEILTRIPTVVIRPPVVYGPGDRDVFLYFRMAKRGLILFSGRLEMELSLIHVEDLTEAIIRALLARESDGKTYYVSDGEVHQVGEVFGELLKIAGRGKVVLLPPLAGRVAGRVGDILSRFLGKPALVNSDKVKEALAEGWVCDSGKIERELGFTPRIDISRGLRETWEWYLQEGWL